MRVTIKAANSQTSTFIIDRDSAEFSEQAIKVPVVRSDKKWIVVDRVWFPLSQISYSYSGSNLILKIPKWLVDKKISFGCTIA